MLVQLGSRSAANDVVDLLVECHTRIRNFLDIARRLAASPEIEVAERREAARQVHRYFTEAFPLHLADENELVVHHLAGRLTALDDALATMQADHVDHAPAIRGLVEITANIVRDPQNRAYDAIFAAAVEHASRILEPHLVLEEREIFPALRALPRELSEQIQAGMRARREAVLAAR